MTLFKKIEYFFFSAKWGRVYFLSSVFLPVILFLIFDRPQNTDIPWVFIVFGLISIYFAANYFWLTQGSQFVVNYKVQSFYNSMLPYNLMLHDESCTDISYISKIYIRNKKNKFEAIQRIWLQVDKKTIILLEDNADNPLLLEPFKSVTRELSPVTHYHGTTARDVRLAIELAPAFDSHSTTAFDHSFGKVERKNFILNKKSLFGVPYDLLTLGEKKVMIQTEDGVFPVEENLKTDDSDLNKFISLLPSIDHGKYGTVLSGKIRAVCYIEMESKPEDIRDQDVWHAFCADQELFEKDEKDKNLSAKNLKDTFIKNKPDQFGLQVVMMKDSGEYSAQYYALTKDNKKYMIDSPVSWWENFYKKYKDCLEKEKADISSERKKLSEPISDIFMNSLKELIGEKNVIRLKNAASFSYKDTNPEGYYFLGVPFRSFFNFHIILKIFIQEKKPTMKILDSSIRYTYWSDIKNLKNMGVHFSEDIVYDMEESLDKKNAFPYK